MVTRTPALEIYRSDVNGPSRFYWRLRAANGEIVADGAEAFTRRSDAKKASERAKQLMAEAVVEVIA